MNNNIKVLSKLLHEMFVINNYAAAIQQPDGKYITKYFPFNSFVIEGMLKAKGAIGCYQQSYRSGFVKWICFDFDCNNKNDPNLLELYEKYVKEIIELLKKNNISYLTEFSGRRGIHVWILFSEAISKSVAYKIINKLYNQLYFIHEEEFNRNYGIDLFPATDSSVGNKVGKQVKIPLSFHTQGGQSFLFEGELNFDSIYNIDFLKNQMLILEKYIPNDVNKICSDLQINSNNMEESVSKFKKFKILNDLDCSADEIRNILCETKVFLNIFERFEKGIVFNQDWFVILGTLGPIDSSGLILHEIYSRSPAYTKAISSKMIDQWRKVYSPATFKHLYSIYGLDMESDLDQNITGLEFLLKKLCLENEIELDLVSKEKWYENELDVLTDVKFTIKKECKYIMYNDENVDISIWNNLNNITSYDINELNKKIDDIKTSDYYNVGNVQMVTYERLESEDKSRTLVSLGAYERIITTHFALQLAYSFKRRNNSYSYNVVFISKSDIFYNWYTSWKNYIGQIRLFMEIPFLSEWGVMTIDIKSFYDNIDFLSVYNLFEEHYDQSEKNIFKYLVKINDKIMRNIDDSRIGVPQGPAYARIISELFLSTILENIPELADTENCKMYRYVDDIVIFYTDAINGNELFDKIRFCLKDKGMDFNPDKSRNYASIKALSIPNREKIIRSNTFNYNLQISEANMMLMESEKNERFNEAVDDIFNINEVGYIFGSKTDDFFTKKYFDKYKRDIFSEITGRGSIFANFYRFLFTNLSYFDESISEDMFLLIKVNSINFKNCISQMYLALLNKQLRLEDVEMINEHFFDHIDMNLTDDEEKTTINSIIQWRKNNAKY